MPENDDREDNRGLQARNPRRPDLVDYAVVGPDEVERIAERLVARACARFLSADETDLRINKLTSARWFSVGIPVSPLPSEPGKPEEEFRELIVHLRTIVADEKVRKSNPYRTLIAVAAVLGGFGGFMSVIFVILGHVAWK